MTAQFALATCPAPLAYRNFSTPYGITMRQLTVAPKECWYEPFRAWLQREDTITAIMDSVEPWLLRNGDSWAEIVNDLWEYEDDYRNNEEFNEGFPLYLDDLDEHGLRTERFPHYAQRTIQLIAKHVLSFAVEAFDTFEAQGDVYNWEYVTGGLTNDYAPTENFNAVCALHDLTFFKDYPIATMLDSNITGWVDREGNEVASPL